jgi:hypothetical protein
MTAPPPPRTASTLLDRSLVHPEFGYLAPSVSLRRRIALVLKGAMAGAFVGAATVFVLVMEREERALAFASTPVVSAAEARPAAPADSSQTTSAPATVIQAVPRSAAAPVRFAAETVALPAALAARAHSKSAPSVAAVAGKRTPGSSPAIAVDSRGRPDRQQGLRDSQPGQPLRLVPAEPEPRAAFAGPFRRAGDPSPFERLPIFGLRWQPAPLASPY